MSKSAVGRVDPIPTEPTPTESEVVIMVPPVPTFSVPTVAIPALIRPELELMSKLVLTVTMPETNTLLHV